MRPFLFAAAAALLLLAPGPIHAQKVALPAEVRGDPGVIVVVRAETDCPALRWVSLDPGLSLIPPELLKDTRAAVVMAGKPGRYRLLAYGALKDQASEPAVCTVVLGLAPGPDPPGPTPPVPPGPAPIPGDGFRALILYESADLSALPREQQAVLYSKQVRDYLNARCAAGPDGKTKEWRVWDVDADPANEAAGWQAAMKKKPGKDKLPWLILSNPAKGGGYEGPLPKTVDEAMTLLKKWAE